MLEIVSYFMSYIIEQVKRRRQERNWSQKYIADCINVSQSFIYKAVIYIFTLINVGIFFLSIPIPGFILSDRVAWNGPVRLSFTDRRNSSLREKTLRYVSVKHHRSGVRKT